MVLGLEFIKYRKTNLQNVILGVAQDLVVFVKLFDGYRLHVCYVVCVRSGGYSFCTSRLFADLFVEKMNEVWNKK